MKTSKRFPIVVRLTEERLTQWLARCKSGDRRHLHDLVDRGLALALDESSPSDSDLRQVQLFVMLASAAPDALWGEWYWLYECVKADQRYWLAACGTARHFTEPYLDKPSLIKDWPQLLAKACALHDAYHKQSNYEEEHA